MSTPGEQFPTDFSVLSTAGARAAEAEFRLARGSLRSGETVHLLAEASLVGAAGNPGITVEQRLDVDFIAD